jgi:hypothetical protein
MKLATRPLYAILAAAAVAASASVASASACNPGENATACVSRLVKPKCASATIKLLCEAKEAAKLLPSILATFAQKAKAAVNSTVEKAREIISHGIARVMGDPNKTSDPKWTGEFCTKDAYFSRFKQDLSFDGITNYGLVKDGVLHRGSQPFVDGQADPSGKKGNGFDKLKAMGIKCRILLRTTTFTDTLLDERKELAARDITLYHFPVPSILFGPTWDKIPDAARVLYTNALTKARDQFMKVVTNPASGPCYLSCQSGKDRTGTLIGWYRAKVQGWKPDKIFREQEDCKFDPSGFFAYYRRVFCRWYTKEIGPDATCAKVLAGH